MIDPLHTYFRITHALRCPHQATACDLYTARQYGEELICDLIAESQGVLLERCIEFAREHGYVVPVDLRGWLV